MVKFDGRNRRSERSQEAILAAVGGLMRGGNFRPSIPVIAKSANVSVRTVYHHFQTIDELYAAVLKDVTVQKDMTLLIMGIDPIPADYETTIVNPRVLHAVVYGRPLQ
jgi:AcrR family transcriptional regulator